jgi:hypothetical protein
MLFPHCGLFRLLHQPLKFLHIYIYGQLLSPQKTYHPPEIREKSFSKQRELASILKEENSLISETVSCSTLKKGVSYTKIEGFKKNPRAKQRNSSILNVDFFQPRKIICSNTKIEFVKSY